MCHQIGRIVTQQKAQHKLYSLVLGFPSTAQLPGYKYIKGWLHHHFSWTLGAVFCQENQLDFLA